jgi:hypothetical protein
MLLNRLQRFALGELKRPMKPSQVAATLGLLAKTLPDLKAIEYSGEIEHTIYEASCEPMSEEDWEAAYCDRLRN